MKKLILSAVAVFAFGFANAQDAPAASGGKGFTNGDIFISGSVGFSSTKNGDFKTNSFNVTPMLGFFVTDNIVIGGLIGYESSTQDQFDGFDTFEVKNNTFTVGAFGRYYATPTSDFSFFGELDLAYATTKQEIEGVDGESKANGFGVALSPGVSYFISEHFALEASIGALSYSSVKQDEDGAEATTSFGLNLDLTDIQLGLVYKF